MLPYDTLSEKPLSNFFSMIMGDGSWLETDILCINECVGVDYIAWVGE